MAQRGLMMRPAVSEDMRLVFDLSNEPSVRSQSFQDSTIPWDEHVGWYLQKMDDPSCLFLLAYCHLDFVGQLRFDVTGNSATVSISICPAWQGQGVGKYCLQEGLDVLKKKYPLVCFVRALVKRSNLASRLFFEACGFSMRAEDVYHGIPTCQFERTLS